MIKKREDALKALYHEEIPKRVPMYDIRIDDYVIQQIMNTTRKIDIETELRCLRKLGFSMVTAHPKNVGTTEIYDQVRGRKGIIDEWGRKYFVVNGMKFYAEGTLQEEDLDLKEWDPTLESRYLDVKEVIRKATDFAVIGRVGGTFERAILSVGPNRFLKSIYDNPKFIQHLLDRINEYWIAVGKRQIDVGVDAILLTDDLAYRSGSYLSPKHMERFIWPTFRKRVKAFQKVPIILHTDGNINSLLDSIVNVGLNGVHSLEPTAGMEIGEVKRVYGDKLVLLGNIDCGELLTHGTEESVRHVVRETILRAAPGGGYFLSTSNGVHQRVKPANLLAMCDACKKYGRYPIKS